MRTKSKNLKPDPKEVGRILGKSLREHRNKSGISQMALGSAASLELSTIHRIESAKTDTNISTLARIKNVLGISWDKLLKGI